MRLQPFCLLLFQPAYQLRRFILFGFQHIELTGQRIQLRRPLVNLLLQLPVALLQVFLLPQALPDALVQYGIFALDGFQRFFLFRNARLHVGHLVVQRVQFLLQSGQQGFLPAYLRALFQKDTVHRFLLLLQLRAGVLDILYLLHELGQLTNTQLPVQFVVTRRPLRFRAQRFHPAFHFAFDIIDTGQIVGCIVQPPGRLFFAHAEPGDAGRLFKYGTPVFRPAVQYFIDLILPDQEHGALAHARICQQIQNIL